ncbi:alpha-ketoglutaric semialdehyde dehydrogenase [Abditibacteriota bacterium]|nr:alpha-ketoglutaric semialdehyde dehydrogenase [Abditibacteriota bacterium]
MTINGTSLIGTGTAPQDTPTTKPFRAFNPAQGAELETEFYPATKADVERAATIAHEAFAVTKNLSGKTKARFLRAIADGLQNVLPQLVEVAGSETALPAARLEGEVGRTVLQLRLFADLIEEGSWVAARLDSPNPERQPLPKPDVRSMMRPLGPVAVFGASNFPFAYSVAGGDTTSALAAGCPVIVKAHPAHPATSALTGEVIVKAARDCDMPEGIFSLLFDSGFEIGTALVSHPAIKAVGFTGSRRGGLSLVETTQKRAEPIPVYAEMSSVNPIFISAGALSARRDALVAGLHQSVTMGLGQFCTNPGLVFLPVGEKGDQFVSELAAKISASAPGSMLSGGIASNYSEGVERLAHSEGVTKRARVQAKGVLSGAALFETNAQTLLDSPELGNEVFGATTLLVRYANTAEVRAIASSLEGQLTATLQLESAEWPQHLDLLALLEEKVGRLIINGFPTGVEVGHAMVHGGPFPATSDGHTTSVGTRAIERFVRPVCYQNVPNDALPPELQDGNPLGIRRMEDGQWTNGE